MLAASSAQNALLSSVLLLLLCPWDDCFSLAAPLLRIPLWLPIAPTLQLVPCSHLIAHWRPVILTLLSLVLFSLFLLPPPDPRVLDELLFLLVLQGRHLLQAVAGSACSWVWCGVTDILFFSGSELTSRDLKTSLRAWGLSFLLICERPRMEWLIAVLC